MVAFTLILLGQGTSGGGGGGTNPVITPAGVVTNVGNLTVSNIVYQVTTLTPSTSVNIDFNASGLQTLAIATNVVFTESNAAAGKSVTVVVSNGATQWTLAGPGWTPVGAAFPATIAASKSLVFTITHTGSSTNSGFVATAAQP